MVAAPARIKSNERKASLRSILWRSSGRACCSQSGNWLSAGEVKLPARLGRRANNKQKPPVIPKASFSPLMTLFFSILSEKI